MIADPIRVDEYYKALVNRDSQYLGSFFVGVKTTKVFCIATCRARKPKRENVIFYKTADDASSNGFRPCKVCKPTNRVDEVPKEIQQLIDSVDACPDNKITDNDIRNLGHSPEKVRRWFKKYMNSTFQSYQRKIRLNGALNNLKEGKKVINSAFDAGYESLSGFSYSFKNLFDQSPQDAAALEVIKVSRIATPLGAMYACASTLGICLLEFVDRKNLEDSFKSLLKRRTAKLLPGSNEHLVKIEKELHEYFDGVRQEFSVALDVVGTSFQKMVWNQLSSIPFGATRSYKDQSTMINKPNAVRAVANANSKNRISIIIPCHRVIGADGKLTGYSGGLPRKQWLLEHEAKLRQEVG